MKKIFCIVLCICMLNFLCITQSSCKKQDEKAVVTYDWGYDNKTNTEDVSVGERLQYHKLYRIGYEFNGWWLVTDNEERLWNFENDIVKDNITLYARWSELLHTITLNSNGGVCNLEKVQVKYGQEYALPTPTREGYYFAGWMLDGYDIAKGVWNKDYDCKCIAKWTTFPPNMTVKMGLFEQDNDFTNGPEEIEWYVIDYQDGKYFLLSKYILTGMQNTKEYTFGYYDWKDSEIRKKLNNDFYNSSFSDEEKEMIVGTNIGDVEDKIFLLSKNDISVIINDVNIAMGIPSDYALGQGIKLSNRQNDFDTTWYYLKDNSCADGLMFSNVPGSSIRGVRPAMWISEEFVKR